MSPGDLVDGRYAVGDRLGRGGMGDVFRAVDAQGGSAVALKVLTSTEPGSDRRFRSEAEVLRRLAHPGIVGMRSAGLHDGAPYLVLDLADGPSLAHELRVGPLGVDRTVDIGAQLADALGHAHEHGITHRDVKPSNILLDGEHRVRLVDFGIARVADGPALTTTGELVGSAPYLAPEQVSGEDVGPPADVYALGLVLAECLTGRPCFPGNGLSTALCRLHRPPSLPDDIPPWLDEALRAMTARAPARRPPVDAVAATLRSAGAVPVVASTGRLGAELTTALADDTDVTEVVGPAPGQPPIDDPERTLVAPTAPIPAGAGPRRAARRPHPSPDGLSVRAMTAVAATIVLIALAVLWARDEGPPDPTAGTVTITTATTATTTTAPPTTATATAPDEQVADGGPPPDAGAGTGVGTGNGNGDGGGDEGKGGPGPGNGNGHGRGEGGGRGNGRGR